MMKKIFRLSIFKKTFLVLLIGFVFVNVLHAYMDVKFTIERVESTLWSYDIVFSNEVRTLVESYSKNYSKLDNEDYHNELFKFRDKYRLTNNLCLLDKDFNIVKDFTTHERLSICFIGSLYNSENSEYINISPNNYVLDETIEEINEYILKAKEKNKKYPYIPLEYSASEGTLKNLKIGDTVVYNFDENNRMILGDLEIYESHDVGYYKYAYGYPLTVDYKKIKEDIINRIKNNGIFSNSFDSDVLRGRIDRFTKNDNIYNYCVYPILVPGTNYEEEEQYDSSQIEGYILVYNYSADGVSLIIYDMIKEKIPVYIGSFVVAVIVCWIISLVFSRRIKKIDKSMSKITNNDFDIHLKEKSKDEIGSLSKNINSMSQKIKETIKSLNEEIERVKKLESVKSEFIANFTHEIKTPLSIINGYIELMEECQDEHKKKEYLEAINKETDRINDLVLSMLNLTRLQSGHVELNINSIDIDELIASAIDSFSLLLQKKNLRVNVDSDSSEILADSEELSVVLKNFISNAIKHTHESGNICITVKDKVIFIENEGSFISDEKMDIIWDTYVSGDREGTGLGLAINKSILDLHEFDYDVYNTDIGVCFKVICKKNGK